MMAFPALAQAPVPNEGTQSQQYVVAFVVYPTPPVRLKSVITRDIRCSCVKWVKYRLGIAVSLGNARDMKPNIPIASASAGDIGITTEGGGHVFAVASRSSEAVLTDEANYKPCASSSREFLLSSPTLKGFYRPIASDSGDRW